MTSATKTLLAVSVGNSRTSFGIFEDDKPRPPRTLRNASVDVLADAIVEEAKGLEGAEAVGLVATVNADLSEPLIEAMEKRLPIRLYRIERDVPPPIRVATRESARTGQDRLLAAAAAFDEAHQACVVIDAGTAITVDFVDGTGVFQGGAIAPGARLMLRSLHEGAAALPEVKLTFPVGEEPFGKDTEEAMLNGVVYGAQGIVRRLVERYAERYGAYPLVIATGGDARLLFQDDELVERITDDLVLRGVALAWRRAVTPHEAPEGDEGD